MILFFSKNFESHKKEIKHVARLAGPITLTSLLSLSLAVIELAFAGRISSEALASVALTNMWVNGTIFFAIGMASALDTLISQAFGAKQFHLIGVIAQRGFILLLAVCVPIGSSWFFLEYILLAMGQDPLLSAMARPFVRILTLAMPAQMLQTVLTRYLMNQHETMGPMGASVLGMLSCVLINFLFVDVLKCGYLSVAFTDVAVKYFMPLSLLMYIRIRRLHASTWTGLKIKEALQWQGVKEFLKIGVPGGVMTALELWSLEVMTMMAGRLGSTIVAAHSIMGNVDAIAYMLPLGLGIAATIRVGNHLGDSKSHQAKSSAFISLFLGVLFSILSCCCVLVTKGSLGKIYSNDEKIVEQVGKVSPVLGFLLIFDSAQCICRGILMGIGRQKTMAIINVIGYGVISLPLGGVLAFRGGLGLLGLWIGFLIGLFFVAAASLFVIFRINWRKECESVQTRLNTSPSSDTQLDSLESQDVFSPTASEQMSLQPQSGDNTLDRESEVLENGAVNEDDEKEDQSFL